MDGVTILNAEEVLVGGGSLVIMATIITILITLGFCVISVGAFLDEEPGVSCLAIIFALCLGYFSYVLYLNTTPVYETRYQVTISDEVNFNEFQQKYEIISQEGLIYTVADKEESE